MRTLSFLRMCRAKGMIGASEALKQYEAERKVFGAAIDLLIVCKKIEAHGAGGETIRREVRAAIAKAEMVEER